MSLDHDVLRSINRDLASPWLDPIMVLVSLLGLFLPYAVFGLSVFRRRRWDAIAFWLAILFAEILVSGLKEIIARPRPEDVRILLSISESYSMPSGHAARAVAGAAALWFVGRGHRYLLGAFALLTLLSRVYVGAHYPSDVLAGTLVGLASGGLALALTLAVRYETALSPADRAPGLRRAYYATRSALWALVRLDYLYTLRLLGRLSGEQATRLYRLTRYWGLLRFFGPMLAVAGAAVVYLSLSPELAARNAACLAGYFSPIGIEIGVPTCITVLDVPWWVVVSSILYIDAWLAVFLILNFDPLYRVPRLGRWLAKAETKSVAFVRKRPWMNRLQFIGVSSVVFVPIVGTGIIPGVLVGRFIGMSKTLVWFAVMLGAGLRITLFALITLGVVHIVT